MNTALLRTLATAALAACSGCATYLDAKNGAPAQRERIAAEQVALQRDTERRDELAGRAAAQAGQVTQQRERIAALERELAQIDASLRDTPPAPPAAADRAAFQRLAALQARKKLLEAELARLAGRP